MTYFLEPLAMIAIFGKANLNCLLQGITNDELDYSVDTFNNCTLRLLKEFGVEGELSLKVYKRGFRPEAGGEVRLKIPFVKSLKAVQLVDEGKVKRIRGVSTASKVSPQILNRIVDSARGVLNDYIPDVWIYTDYFKGFKGGNSPGYAVNLVAESTTGSLIAVDECLEVGKAAEDNLPEELGTRVAMRLLDELFYSGFVDTTHQSLVFLLMALSEKKISAVRVGRISTYTVKYLRNLRTFFGVKFQIKNCEDKIVIDEETKSEEENGYDMMKDEDDDSETKEEIPKEFPQNLIFSCWGIGFNNIAKKIL
eukprot:CAMPEP_0176420004 /NCGR_PEP_ID=MMETSP0127-20121128/8366_1 /TAXON_ID=938130 /ORGANISM="Platyophrya macrostoma, Strain WH" /LENGTH=308 /DNA_ID=CAMNT_0017800553 /DNA_START=302 /DNA_END=1228 /DNA_ORIENTATION=-